MRKINDIIIHCSATPEGHDYTIQDITNWHKQEGFTTIGYHYVIYRDGSIHVGRPLSRVGAHCKGHNSHSIGICYIGGVGKDGKTPKDTRTPAQKQSLRQLLATLRHLYPDAGIHGHHDYNRHKDCPCFNATLEYRNV